MDRDTGSGPSPSDSGSGADARDADGFGAEGMSVLAKLHGQDADVLPVMLRDLDAESDPLVRAGAAAPEPGRRYKIIGEIARGGVGVVLKGYDVDLGRNVAMKVIRSEYEGHPEVLRRFVEEAQIGGQLQHPGIVPVYEIGLDRDGRPYFTMKLVKGKTLATLLGECADLAAERHRFVALFASVCQTMSYAHARGVIHRDLKPNNVMVGNFGEVVVVDWGMGKVIRQGGVEDEREARRRADETLVATLRSQVESDQSLVGSVLGTPRYMPPEQARGAVAQMDERSDVFALGGVLTEILTGKPTYTGTDHDVIRKAARGEVEEAHERLRACGADKELVDLAVECLSPAREARPAHAGKVAESVNAYLASIDKRIQASRLEAAEARGRAAEERRAHRVTVVLGGAVALALLTAAGVWWWQDRRRADRESRAAAQVAEALEEAAKHRSDRKWTEALAAATRAQQLSADAPEELRSRARAAKDELARESRTAEERAELERSNRALLAAFERARPVEGDERYPQDWPETDRRMREAFVEQGLDVDAGTPAEAAARFGARGIPIELAAALDVWALVRRRLADEAGFARLARIADLLDGDETRSRVRLAIAERDAAALKTLAQRDDVLRLPVATLQILGSGLRGVGAVHEAAALLEPAHRRHPDDFLICLHLARALHEANERDASARYFMTAIALNPSSPVATSEAGQELYNVREYARAQAVYEAGLAAWPEDAVLHCQLAWALRAQGLTDRAEAESAESVRLAPRSPWVRASRGSMLTNRRPVDEAAIFAEFDEAMRLAPQSGLVIGWAAEACMELRKPDRAWELARKAIELDPTSPKLREIYGWIAAHNGHADEAVASAREAVRLGPGRFESHHSLAEALLGKYRLEEALAEAQTAVRLNPKVVNGHLLLACIWFELGWFERARACHERARELGGTAFGSGMLEFFQATERRAAAESRYLAILEGNLKARDVEEMVGASCAGAMRDWPLAAFRQMQAAFRADLAYVRDPKKYEPHFIGLTAAARAILGRGDAAKIGADERAELGEQALEWLRDMLEIRVAFESRERLCGLIEIWLTCSEVAGIRDEEGLAKLPPDLAARLRAAWQDVRARRDAAKR